MTNRDNRPLRYTEPYDEGPDDGPTEQVVYRASSLGACDVQILATAAGMQGADKPAWFQEVLDEGSMAEGDIASLWEAETGIETIDEQLEVELVIAEDLDGRRVIIRGHIDGRAGSVLREYKKFRESTWPNFLRQGIEVNKNYPWQFSTYWHALNITYGEFVGGHIAGYIDASTDWIKGPPSMIYPAPEGAPDGMVVVPYIDKVVCKPVTAPPIALKDIRRKIFRWERLINEGTPLSEGRCEKPFSYPCPFFALHPDDDEPEVYAIAKANKVVGAAVCEVHEATTEIAELAAKMRVLDKQRKEATKVLQEELAKMGEEADTAKVLTYDGLSITRNRGPRKGYVVADGFTDSFAATKEEKDIKPAAKMSPAQRAAATEGKAAVRKTLGTTRVGGRK